MRWKDQSSGRLAFTAAVAAALVLAGCAVKTAPPVAAPAAVKAAPAGTVLEYKMPAGQLLQYKETGEVREVTDVMGQTLETVTSSANAYSFRAKGRTDGNFLLGVTLDDMAMTINSVQGDLSPDLKQLKGKGFDMVISPLGAEIDVSGAEAITYQMVTGPRNVSPIFKVFFPDMPGKPVQIGDTWPSTYVIEEKGGPANVRIDFQGVNTLEGFESVDGLECARIVFEYTGSISGTGSQQGLDMLFGGQVKGTDHIYFAVKEGLYVKSAGSSVAEMTISVSGAQSMTVPSTQKRTSEVTLVGR